MRGIEGPQISMSKIPTSLPWFARRIAIYAAVVLLPTPPFPERTIILCFIFESF